MKKNKSSTKSKFPGLVHAPTIGPCSALRQRVPGHHVLQVADIVQAVRRGTHVHLEFIK